MILGGRDPPSERTSATTSYTALATESFLTACSARTVTLPVCPMSVTATEPSAVEHAHTASAPGDDESRSTRAMPSATAEPLCSTQNTIDGYGGVSIGVTA